MAGTHPKMGCSRRQMEELEHAIINKLPGELMSHIFRHIAVISLPADITIEDADELAQVGRQMLSNLPSFEPATPVTSKYTCTPDKIKAAEEQCIKAILETCTIKLAPDQVAHTTAEITTSNQLFGAYNKYVHRIRFEVEIDNERDAAEMVARKLMAVKNQFQNLKSGLVVIRCRSDVWSRVVAGKVEEVGNNSTKPEENCDSHEGVLEAIRCIVQNAGFEHKWVVYPAILILVHWPPVD